MKKAIVIFGIFFVLLLSGLYRGFVLVKTMQEGNDSTEITIHAPAATSTNTAIAHNLLHQWLTYFTQRMYVSADS